MNDSRMADWGDGRKVAERDLAPIGHITHVRTLLASLMAEKWPKGT